MEQFDSRIEEAMKMKLDGSEPSVRFGTVWNKHKKKSRKIFGIRRVIAIPGIVLIALLALSLVGFKINAIVDKTDYPFVNDQQVIGKWQIVDMVETVDQFSPDKKLWQSDLILKELAFINEGKMLISVTQGNGKLGPTNFKWTQGMVLNKWEKTASKYEFKDINGTSYMFLECKSGDYTYFHKKPWYLVLTKVDDTDYSNYKPTAIEDKVDYPFVDDPQLIGTWETVDYVKTIDDFNTMGSIQSMIGNLFLVQLDIVENGKISAKTTEGNIPEGFLTWTKGLILDTKHKIASKYEIKEIKGDTYLFYEWKSGDYSYREIKPEYFVLKKVK